MLKVIIRAVKTSVEYSPAGSDCLSSDFKNTTDENYVLQLNVTAIVVSPILWS